MSEVISRNKALLLAPDLVAHEEGHRPGLTEKLMEGMEKLKRGQKVVVAINNEYHICKVSSVKNGDWRNEDGAVIRVRDGDETYRIDGCYWAVAI